MGFPLLSARIMRKTANDDDVPALIESEVSSKVDILFMLVTIAFILQKIIYNNEPIRFKDITYIDVLTESVNNPIRLLLGWFMIDSSTIPIL